MKGVSSKPVCCYCHKLIDKKPIKVGNSYAHENCIKHNATMMDYLYGSPRVVATTFKEG